jgi:hypothetical protein
MRLKKNCNKNLTGQLSPQKQIFGIIKLRFYIAFFNYKSWLGAEGQPSLRVSYTKKVSFLLSHMEFVRSQNPPIVWYN